MIVNIIWRPELWLDVLDDEVATRARAHTTGIKFLMNGGRVLFPPSKNQNAIGW